jgi:hypothetical protein
MDQLTANQRILLAVAWVDGQAAPAEATFLRRVLANGTVDAQQVESYLQKCPITLEQALAGPAATQPEELMQEVLRMCFVDGVLEVEEFDLIDRLARHLGITSDQLEQMRERLSEE